MKQLKSAVLIIIIQPIPSLDSNVEVQSVHVNWPGGLLIQTGPVHDPIWYSEAEKSVVKCGMAVFHKCL